MTPTAHNEQYLRVKQEKLGHMFTQGPADVEDTVDTPPAEDRVSETHTL